MIDDTIPRERRHRTRARRPRSDQIVRLVQGGHRPPDSPESAPFAIAASPEEIAPMSKKKGPQALSTIAIHGAARGAPSRRSGRLAARTVGELRAGSRHGHRAQVHALRQRAERRAPRAEAHRDARRRRRHRSCSEAAWARRRARCSRCSGPATISSPARSSMAARTACSRKSSTSTASM